MSNVISGNPIIVDTAASTVVVSSQFLVQSIFWDNVAPADADTLTVKDKNGVVKFNEVLKTGNLITVPMFFNPPLLFDGLIVSAMTHGKVYIYLAQSNNLQA